MKILLESVPVNLNILIDFCTETSRSWWRRAVKPKVIVTTSWKVEYPTCDRQNCYKDNAPDLKVGEHDAIYEPIPDKVVPSQRK